MPNLFLNCVDDLPDILGFDDCEPNFVFGEIEQVIIGSIQDESDVLDTLDEGKWEDFEDHFVTEVDADHSSDFYAFLIPGRGTMDEPDQPEVEASRYRRAYPPAERTIEFNVDDIPDGVYDALNDLHNQTVRLWAI